MQSAVWRLLEPHECPAWALGRYAEVWQKRERNEVLFAAVLAHHLSPPAVFEVFREVDGHPQLQRLAVETELEREVGPALVSVAMVVTDMAPPARHLTLVPAEPASPPGEASVAACQHCGHVAPAKAKFCPVCGQSQAGGTLDAPTLQALAALGAEDDRARAAVVPTACADGMLQTPSVPTGRVTAAMDTAAPVGEEIVLMEAQSTPLSLHERATAIFGVAVVVEAAANDEEGGEE